MNNTPVQRMYAYTLKPLFQVLTRENIAVAPLIRQSGMPPEVETDGRKIITIAEYIRLMHNARRASITPHLGLELGLDTELSQQGPIGYAELSAKNLQQARALGREFKHTFRLPSLFDAVCQFTDDEYSIKLVLPPLESETHKMLVEWGLASFAKRIDELAGYKVKPRRLYLNYSAPQYADKYRNIFDCNVFFKQSVSAIFYSRSILDIPISGHDPDINNSAYALCQSLTLKLMDKVTLTDEVCALIKSRGRAFPDIEYVANKMHVSSRTLRRQLSQQNTSYQKILNTCRQETAEYYLLHTDKRITEITHYCGFSEPQSFFKAFKQWTGKTPGQYRKMYMTSSASI